MMIVRDFTSSSLEKTMISQKLKPSPLQNPNKKGLPKSGKPLIVVKSFPEDFYIHAH
jgi:hypothetical protein